MVIGPEHFAGDAGGFVVEDFFDVDLIFGEGPGDFVADGIGDADGAEFGVVAGGEEGDFEWTAGVGDGVLEGDWDAGLVVYGEGNEEGRCAVGLDGGFVDEEVEEAFLGGVEDVFAGGDFDGVSVGREVGGDDEGLAPDFVGVAIGDGGVGDGGLIGHEEVMGVAGEGHALAAAAGPDAGGGGGVGSRGGG